MAKFVPDIKTQRWVVIAPQRQERPNDHEKKPAPKVCPFCFGHESLTPPEISRVSDGEKWKMRVVPNKFPITDIHEVIIHSPHHDRDIEDLEIGHIHTLLTTYKERFLSHFSDGHVMIFCNHGEKAGASLAHPHSQLVVIPKQINIDALSREPVMNIIEDHRDFVSYCPDFSQWPYEVWISPKEEDTYFSQFEGDLSHLSIALKSVITRLKKIHDQNSETRDTPFAYNYYIHHGKNWFVRVIPRFVHRAGFELGTGLSVNSTDPTKSAEKLREI